MTAPDAAGDGSAPDPVLVRRERFRRAASTGQAIGYALFGLAVVLFVVGFVAGFPGPIAGATVAALALGSVVLLPAIIVGYAVKAADREDREAAG